MPRARIRRSSKTLALLASAVGCVILASPQPSPAVTTTTWIGASGNWTDPTNWSAGVPTNGAIARIFNTDANDRTINYNYPGFLDTFSFLNINNANGGTTTLIMNTNGFSLNAGGEKIGGGDGLSSVLGGEGTLTESAGANIVQTDLNIGSTGDIPATTPIIGSYTLSGTGTLTVGRTEYIGANPSNNATGIPVTGTFVQTGGTHSFFTSALDPIGSHNPFGLIPYNLVIGNYGNNVGNYFLSGTGLLNGVNEEIGNGGHFTQTGGVNTLGILQVQGGGSYSLAGTGIVNGGFENVVESGSVTQSGGTNAIGTAASLTADSSGSYILSGTGVLSSASPEIMGSKGTGTFIQSGGTNAINSTNTSTTAGLYLANSFGSAGTYSLSGTGALSCNRPEYIGFSGAGIFNQSGGSNSISGTDQNLHQSAELFLAYNAGSTGSYALSGTGSLSTVGTQYVGYKGSGTFIQTGGNNNVAANLILGANPGATGSYSLSGTGVLTCPNSEGIGATGIGFFSQSGGTNTTQFLDVGVPSFNVNPPGTGTYVLTGSGAVISTHNENIGSNPAVGTFIQSGGTNTVTSPTGFISVNASSTYTLTAGTVTAPNFTLAGILTSTGAAQISVANSLLLIGAGRANLNAFTTAVGNLSITGNALVNINGSLLINYAATPDPLPAILTYLKSGYNNGAWTGTSGILSTDAATSPKTFALAVIDSNNPADTTAAANLGLQQNQLLIRFTRVGDANTDGSVSFSDLQAIAPHYHQSNTDWATGDFNLDGVFNFADLSLLVQNYPAALTADQAALLPPGFVTDFQAAGGILLPEPGMFGIAVSAASLLIARRRPTTKRTARPRVFSRP